MAQPQWITSAGSLGVIPEGIFYQIPVQATAGDDTVYFQLISGRLPKGIQVTTAGIVEGVPKNIIDVQGVPTEVSTDVTSKFSIRAYTKKIDGTVDQVNDRTFQLTVTGQDIPEFVTPAGSVGEFYDGTEAEVQIEFSDPDPDDDVIIRLISGGLPPGLTLNTSTGLISGIIQPLIDTPADALPGFDAAPYSAYPFDFATRSSSKNYQFTLEITDGKNNNIRTFEIYVYSKDSMSSDTNDFTSDNTFITSDVVPLRTPVLIAPVDTNLGQVRADNYYAIQFQAVDFDGDAIEYSISTGAGVGFDSGLSEGDPGTFDYVGGGFDRGTFSLPPGLNIDADTGWFYGYIPDQGATEASYRFAIRVYKKNNPDYISEFYYYNITIVGDTDTEVTWLTDSNLGTIDNGDISQLYVEAVNVGGRALQYRIPSGSTSKLPQGLTLQPSGNITGRVSFNTFTLDSGTTTFDKELPTRLNIDETTFDMEFDFDVNAYAPVTEQQGFIVSSINILNGGTGYTSQPTVTISAPPATENAVQATAGVVTIDGGVITAIAVGNPGRGYIDPPTVTITGGGGVDAEAKINLIESELLNSVSITRRFKITVNRAYNQPYENLYVKAMPPYNDRDLITGVLQDQSVLSESLLYRPDDPNFGVSNGVSYVHAYGLTVDTLEDYVTALQLNHYRKSLTLGSVNTAQALDSQGNVVYEVIYSNIIDDLVNDQGESVGKSVELSYPVIDPQDGSTEIDTVYPNSLINMRNQVIDSVGRTSNRLPLWMTSRQPNGQILGYRPVWVIAYVKPGQASRVKYLFDQAYSNVLNRVDYEVDRYELDRSQTYLYDPESGKWIPSPPVSTTFDRGVQSQNLNYIGTVDYATTLAFTEINYRTLEEIDALGGIDGIASRSGLDGKTLIFQRQEAFGVLTPDEAFTNFTSPFDFGEFDSAVFDVSSILTTTQRLSIWRINVAADNVVTLEYVSSPAVNDYVTVLSGNTFARDLLYLPNAPTPGLTRRTWSYIPEVVTTETIFDGRSTVFSAPADRWTNTDVHDKYIVFPKTNILG